MDGKEADGPTEMVAFEKVVLWPLIAIMFILGIYPTFILNYFNGNAIALLEQIKVALGG